MPRRNTAAARKPRVGAERAPLAPRAVTPAPRRSTLSPRVRAALRAESDRALGEQIQRLLALPMNKRTNFLRVRIPGGGSAL